MKSWREEYIKALQARDTLEKSQEHYIHAYTKLADRAASSENAVQNPTSTERHSGDNPAESLYRSISKDDRATAVPNAQSQQQKLMTDLRKNLSRTQHVRADLEEKVGVMATKIDQITADLLVRKRLIDELSKEKTTLEWKLRDRDEEIKGKTRLVEEVQNEMISLNLQLNMVEQRSGKLEKENKELVERWMKLKGREADDMNKASDWR